jgi:dihydroorotate dehydrogenase
MFKRILRPTLFRISGDPENAHGMVMAALSRASHIPAALRIIEATHSYQSPSLQREVFGVRFPNPVGLAGGFDKNGRALPALAALGFGFVEAGGVTRHPQPGQPRPRIFRLPADDAMINRMGLPNEGADAVAANLAREPRPPIPIGWQIAKSKETPLEEAPEDCVYTLRALYPYADYFSINVSSPNTPGLRRLQERELLAALLDAVVSASRSLAGAHQQPKPILVKLSPDLTDAALDEALDVCVSSGVRGIIATNTTITRDGLRTPTKEEGGLSGRPLTTRSLEVVRYICKRLDEKMPVIGVGGIFGPDDAKKMLDAGAALIQIYTSFIFEGPGIAGHINRGLV